MTTTYHTSQTVANYSVIINMLKRLTAESLDIFGQPSLQERRESASSLRTILQDKGAQFRSPQQEEAVRLATAKQSLLVAILPTGSRKSLVFMVLAILVGVGVTIVVALYAELKR
ncbi:hypothetical protein LB507_011678 [Fusarium sp. FIESC RH6]|nr:hypothetical protein LB507_011678 [Fusarium sp. FIESC RH6]